MKKRTLVISMLFFFGIVGTVWACDTQPGNQPNDSQNTNVGNVVTSTPTCTPTGGMVPSETPTAGASATVTPTQAIVLPQAAPATGR